VAQVTITRGETQTATIVQTTTVTPVPPATSTESSGVNPAAAAAAAAAASNDEESSTDWGWVAFGILAGAVLIFGVVWWLRRRHARNGDGGDAPPVSA
jgi:cobalamin biosynthesis Mg chelatase CobN